MIPTEQQEAEKLVAWLRLKKIRFTHIPNETGGDLAARRRAVRMKRAGVSRGFPDYVVYLDGYTLYIELKRQQGGRVSPEQREWLDFLSEQPRSYVKVAHGADEAIEWINGIAESTKIV